MALKLAIRSTDTLRVIAPGDDAIDWLETSEDHVKRYFGGEYDLGLLVLKDGGVPSWVTVRALTEHERTLVEWDGTDNPGQHAYETVRFGLVGIEGLDAWKPAREAYCGSQVLTWAAVEQLEQPTILFASGVIRRLSMLSEERKRFFGASAPSRGGATPRTESPSIPTASKEPATAPETPSSV